MTERVYIVDDDAGLRDALAFQLLAHGFDAVLYASAMDFLEDLPVPRGCVLTDIRMPGLSGLDLVRVLKERGEGLPVVVMTGHGDVALAVEAMKAGVSDFIEKPFGDAQVVDAIRRALAPDSDEPANLARRTHAEGRLADLSPRERDVLTGVVQGKLNKQIAHDLEISARTVEIYRANLMTKTGAHNIAQLMRIALAAGL